MSSPFGNLDQPDEDSSLESLSTHDYSHRGRRGRYQGGRRGLPQSPLGLASCGVAAFVLLLMGVAIALGAANLINADVARDYLAKQRALRGAAVSFQLGGLVACFGFVMTPMGIVLGGIGLAQRDYAHGSCWLGLFLNFGFLAFLLFLVLAGGRAS